MNCMQTSHFIFAWRRYGLLHEFFSHWMTEKKMHNENEKKPATVEISYGMSKAPIQNRHIYIYIYIFVSNVHSINRWGKTLRNWKNINSTYTPFQVVATQNHETLLVNPYNFAAIYFYFRCCCWKLESYVQYFQRKNKKLLLSLALIISCNRKPNRPNVYSLLKICLLHLFKSLKHKWKYNSIEMITYWQIEECHTILPKSFLFS